MADRITTLDEALTRLEALLPERDPELLATLNPPVADSELRALREALAPHELHQDVETLLRWHNGQTGQRWWPVIDSGPLLSARGAREHYRLMTGMCEPFQWSPSWVPIAHEGWYTIAVECGVPLSGLVIDAGFPDPPSPKALSLTEMLRAPCELLEAGFPLDDARGTGADKAGTAAWLDVLRSGYPHYLQ